MFFRPFGRNIDSRLLDEPLLLRVRIDEIGPEDLRLYLTSLGTIALRAA